MNRFRERQKEKELVERKKLSKTALDFPIPARYTEENPLIVDNSILSAFATCHTRAMISYHHNLASNNDSNSLRVGQATHKALEHFFRGGTAKEAMAIFRKLYFPYGNVLDPEEYLSWENTSVTFETWLAGHALENLVFKPMAGTIEGAVVAPLWPEQWGKRVLYLGLIDLLVQDKVTGGLAIMDHKATSKRLDDSWTNQFKTSSQLSGYLWLAKGTRIHEKLGMGDEITAAYINTIQYSKLPTSERKCARHAVTYSVCKGLHAVARIDGPFTRSPLQLSQWLGEARGLAAMWANTREIFSKIEHLSGVGKEGLFQYEACRFCPFTDFCSGLIADSRRLPEFFRESKWEPWKEIVG